MSMEKNYPNAVLSDKIRSMYLGIDDPNPVPDSMVETRMLSGNIFYIKLWGELDADLKETGSAPSTIELFPNGDTLGYYGTSGSFGLAGAEIKIPGGLTVHFLFGQSLNKEHSIQLDSTNGVGGVTPSVRIEMTAERAINRPNSAKNGAVYFLHLLF